MQASEENLIMSAIHILAHELHENALLKGFWQDEDDLIFALQCVPVPVEQAGKMVRLQERIIQLFNSEKIALEHSELSERLEACRHDPNAPDEHCPDFTKFEIEAADAVIRILETCNRRKARIGEAIIAKHNFNRTRPPKHGKNF